jgi:hypothetical protein
MVPPDQETEAVVDCPESMGDVVVRGEMARAVLTITRSVGEVALAGGLPAELSNTL